jgi:hypothetical protein
MEKHKEVQLDSSTICWINDIIGKKFLSKVINIKDLLDFFDSYGHIKSNKNWVYINDTDIKKLKNLENKGYTHFYIS